MKVLAVTNMYPSRDWLSYGSFIKSQIDSLVDKGVEIDLIYIVGHKSRFNYLWAMFSVFWRCLRHRYDCVHAHYGTTGLVVRVQFRYPMIVSYCGDDLYGHSDEDGRPTPRSMFLVWWHKRLARWVDASIVKSEGMRLLLPNGDGIVIPNGVDFDLFRPLDKAECRRELGLSEDVIYVLFPYDPAVKRKNYPTVEAAVKKLNETDGRRHEILVVHGVPNEKIPLYMNAANVLVLVSYWEGSPNAIKEGMACNLPIVATDVGDVRELIDGVEGCLLCRPEPDDLAEKLRAVLAGPTTTNGREAIDHLRIDKVADRVIDVYRKVVAKSRDNERRARATNPS